MKGFLGSPVLKRAFSGSPLRGRKKEALADCDEYSQVEECDVVEGRYVGTMVNGLKHGQGKLIWHDGDSYSGAWANDMKHGHGIMSWTNGDTYEGNWEQDQRHGVDTKTTYRNGGSFIGTFERDTRTGPGKLLWPDGDVFEGNWKEGRRVGTGVLITRDGKKFDQTWDETEANYSVSLPAKHPEGYGNPFIDSPSKPMNNKSAPLIDLSSESAYNI
ncbi:hypothetical protein PROFUN_13155 [Planoprotostelium fungivorum]|uniref:Uncharacterized protein n=1 Tax=Planoprotostelium fungivorum TaxID=1890364 RepID=A0A2P6N572_9EUKA|nr:hypothetical protein PROFUN_13155 [Planoprotostelium fungivorum]